MKKKVVIKIEIPFKLLPLLLRISKTKYYPLYFAPSTGLNFFFVNNLNTIVTLVCIKKNCDSLLKKVKNYPPSPSVHHGGHYKKKIFYGPTLIALLPDNGTFCISYECYIHFLKYLKNILFNTKKNLPFKSCFWFLKLGLLKIFINSATTSIYTFYLFQIRNQIISSTPTMDTSAPGEGDQPMSDQQPSGPDDHTAATQDIFRIDAEKQKTGRIPSSFPSFISLGHPVNLTPDPFNEQPIDDTILSPPNIESSGGTGMEIEDSENVETTTEASGGVTVVRAPDAGASCTAPGAGASGADMAAPPEVKPKSNPLKALLTEHQEEYEFDIDHVLRNSGALDGGAHFKDLEKIATSHTPPPSGIFERQKKIEVFEVKTVKAKKTEHLSFQSDQSRSVVNEIKGQFVNGEFAPPNFNADPRSLSSLTEGNNRIKNAKSSQTPELGGSYTCSAEMGNSELVCHCTEKGQCLDSTGPLVLIIADGYCPPVLGGGGGKCAIVLRIENGDFVQAQSLVKSFFSKKIHAKRTFGQSLLPDNSIVIISLTNLLLLTGSTSYLAQSAWFQTWLSNYLFNSGDNSSGHMKAELRQSINLKNTHILDIICPYVNLGSEAAMAVATVNYVSGQVFNCKELPLLADVFDVYSLFLESGKHTQVKILPQVLQPYHLSSLPPGDLCPRILKPIQNLDYPLGLEEGDLTMRLLIKYWTLIMDKVSAHLTAELSSSLASRNIPNQSSIETGIKLASLGGLDVSPISNFSVPPGVKKTFLVGASHMMRVHELFNDAGKFPPMIGDTTIFIGLQNKRLDPSSGSVALKNLQRSAKEGDLVVLDPFCNNVINPIGTNVDSNTRPIKPYTTHQQGTRNNIFHLSNGNGDTKVELASPEHLDVLCGEVDKIVSSLRKKKIDVLILGPIPRFPAHCCTDPNHGLVNSNVNTLTRLYRDLNTFLSRSSLSNQPRSALKGALGTLPFFALFDNHYIDEEEPWQGCQVIQRDNVHLVPKVQLKLTELIYDCGEALRNGIWKPNPIIPDSISFSFWLQKFRAQNDADNDNDGVLAFIKGPYEQLTNGEPLSKKKRAVSAENLAPNPEPAKKRKKRPLSTETAGFSRGGGRGGTAGPSAVRGSRSSSSSNRGPHRTAGRGGRGGGGEDTLVLTWSGIFTEIVTLTGIGETTAASASTGVDEKCNKYKY